MATASILAAVAIAALLAGGAGGVLVYKQIEYGTPPDWQGEIISRITMTSIATVNVTNYSFEYQGNSRWTDLYGSGRVEDVGMWSLVMDATSPTLKWEHLQLLDLFLVPLPNNSGYQVIASIILPYSGCIFQYSGTPVSGESSSSFLLTLASDYTMTSHIQR